MQRDLEWACLDSITLEKYLEQRLTLLGGRFEFSPEMTTAMALDVCSILIEQRCRVAEQAYLDRVGIS